MDTLKINWEQTNWSQIDQLSDTRFYAFTRGGNLLYIGIAYHQTASAEVRNTLSRLQVSTTGLSIWLGYIDLMNSTYGRVSEQIVKDAECLMINANQPVNNTQCIKSYNGRMMKVKSSGCHLIRNCVRYENNKVYRSC